jgi:hypothetical protein
MALFGPDPRRGWQWSDDERRMASFFPKLFALAAGLLALLALLVWLAVHIAC